MRFANKAVLITGAGSGIGAASARLLAKEGAAIGVMGRTAATVERTVREVVEAKGRALSRDAIFNKVWGPGHHGTPRTIDNFIQQLRAKLEISPQEPKHFHTVRGVGYRFDA